MTTDEPGSPEREPSTRQTRPGLPRSRRRRLLLGGLVLASAVFAVWLAVCVAVFANPAVDARQQVDAIYLLGPIQHQDDAAVALTRELGVPVLLMTAAVDQVTGARYAVEHCGESTSTYRVECVLPDPYTTRGEARLLGDQVRQHGWKRVAVISTKGHLTRTRLLMDRCVPAEVLLWERPLATSAVGWLKTFVYESAAWTSVRVDDSC